MSSTSNFQDSSARLLRAQQPTNPEPPRLTSILPQRGALRRRDSLNKQPVPSSKPPSETTEPSARLRHPSVPVSAWLLRQPSTTSSHALPRSLTTSNLPRPVSDWKPDIAQERSQLSASFSSGSLIHSRIPTPSHRAYRMTTQPINMAGVDDSVTATFSAVKASTTSSVTQQEKISRHLSLDPAAMTFNEPRQPPRFIPFSSTEGLVHTVTPTRPKNEFQVRQVSCLIEPADRKDRRLTVPPSSYSIRDHTSTRVGSGGETACHTITKPEAQPLQLSPSRKETTHDIKQYRLLKTIDTSDATKAARISFSSSESEFKHPVASHCVISNEHITSGASQASIGPGSLSSASIETLTPGSKKVVASEPVPATATKLSKEKCSGIPKWMFNSSQDPEMAISSAEKERLGAVHRSMPIAWWAGRFVSINDRLMTDSSDFPRPNEENATGKMITCEEKRFKRVFTELEACCMTVSAKESLSRFRREWAIEKRMPDFLKPSTPIPGDERVSIDSSVEHDTSPAGPRTLRRWYSAQPQSIPRAGQTQSHLRGLHHLASVTSFASLSSQPRASGQEKVRKNSFVQRLMGIGK